jgi:ABC-type branched-subunit amino acid transport system permease subunit
MTAPTASAEPGVSQTRGLTTNSVARDFAPIVIVAALLALIPINYQDSRSMMTVIIAGMLFMAYTIGFNVIFGSTGQLFLCTGALAGIGGFTSAIISDRAGIPMLISIVLAGALAALVGGLLSWIAVSRSLDTIFTGIVTLAFSLSFQNFILGRGDLTGGEDGLRIEAGKDTILDAQVKPYYVFLALVVVYLVLYRVIQRSNIGWAFRALRDDEVAAELAGVDVTRYRVYAGLIGSAMLGVAGALFAHHRGFIGTSTYAFGNVDVRVLVMLAFGGIGTLLGPVLGAVVFTILDEILDSYQQLREVLYGIITVALFLGFRQGFIPALSSAWNKLFSGRVRGPT